MDEPNWDLYRSMLAVLEEGSLTAAAKALGLAQPTLGRHIETLEAALGYALFVRSRHGLLPTEQALQLKPFAQALAANANALLRAASGSADAPRGTVRVTASEVIGCEVLPPILTGLQRQYPQLQIELVLTNRPQDLLRREADIAVRMVRPTQEALIARHLGAVELGLHAHRDYLAQRGTPSTLADLQTHTLIGYDHETAFIRSIKHHLGDLTRTNFALRSDSDLAQLAALRAGFGIGVCQNALAARNPELVRVLPQDFSPRLDTWLAMHEDLRESKRCTVVFAALADGLKSYMDG
ncbi:MAG: LysR family transcriptional regulator [Massilia sp.]